MADLPTGWTVALMTGIAQYLDAKGIGSWDPSGVYPDDDRTAITLDMILPAPARLITITEYFVRSMPGLADVTAGVQIRVRGTKDPRVRRNISDAIRDELDGWAPREQLNGISVVQFVLSSGVTLGRDGNDRWQSSHNYYVDAMRPTSNNTD